MRPFYAAKKNPDGSVRLSDAIRFGIDIDGERFWFAVHQPLGLVGALVISHWDSGMKVCDIPYLEQLAGVGVPRRKMARAYLEKFVHATGEARVASVLRGAPDIVIKEQA